MCRLLGFFLRWMVRSSAMFTHIFSHFVSLKYVSRSSFHEIYFDKPFCLGRKSCQIGDNRSILTKERLGKVSQLYIPNSAHRHRIAHRWKIAYFHKERTEESLICSSFEAFWANISFLWNIAICSSYHLEQVDQSRPLEQYTYPNDHLQNGAI